MQFHQRLGERKAKTGAFFALGHAAADLGKRRQRALDVVFRDANPRIGDLHRDAAVVA